MSFENGHHLVDERVVEVEPPQILDGLFDERHDLQGEGGGAAVGVDEAGHSEEGSSEVSDHDDACVCDASAVELTEDGPSSGPGRLSGIGGAESGTVHADAPSVAQVGGLCVFLAEFSEVVAEGILRRQGEGEGKEAATPVGELGVGALFDGDE